MKIALLGDIALFGDFSSSRTPDLPARLKPLADYLDGFDHVIGNLETPFSSKRKRHGAKSAYLCSDPENIGLLKLLHISAVSLANNHIYDYGREGVETTIRLLDDNRIEWFGLDGKNLIIEEDGNRLAFEGLCCYSTNPLKLSPKPGGKGINALTYPEIERLLQKNQASGLLTVLSVHSGIEHVICPSLDQIRITRSLADKTDFIWHGHHPHVVQGIESYKGSLIAHSLGNFLFSEFEGDSHCPRLELTEENRTGMILELEIENNSLTGWNVRFTRIEDSGSISLISDPGLLHKYTSLLEKAHSGPELYESERKRQREAYLSRRKEMRNLKWVMKRLRPRYFRLLLDYRNNKSKYDRAVKSHLKTFS